MQERELQPADWRVKRACVIDQRSWSSECRCDGAGTCQSTATKQVSELGTPASSTAANDPGVPCKGWFVVAEVQRSVCSGRSSHSGSSSGTRTAQPLPIAIVIATWSAPHWSIDWAGLLQPCGHSGPSDCRLVAANRTATLIHSESQQQRQRQAASHTSHD